jgi:integrase/recombinase XerD
MTSNGLCNSLGKLGISAGVKVTPHMLRRTFALMSLSGMDILSLQHLMGHTDLSITSDYVQMLDADLIAAHKEHDLDA